MVPKRNVLGNGKMKFWANKTGFGPFFIWGWQQEI